MNLLEIRKQFVQTSGRYDLVNDDNTDNGANFYIQAGQKHLENLTHYDKSTASYYVQLNGLSGVILPGVRTVKQVFAQNLTSGPIELTRISLADAKKIISDSSEGCELPSFYILVRSRGNAENLYFGFELLETASETDISDGTRFDSHALVVFPPIESTASVNLDIHGIMRESLMQDDEDENFWSLQWPNLLLYAALRELEVFYRNSQGIKDWDLAINGIVTALEFDAVQDESDQVSVIKG